jgi:micrococcal nuclease
MIICIHTLCAISRFAGPAGYTPAHCWQRQGYASRWRQGLTAMAQPRRQEIPGAMTSVSPVSPQPVAISSVGARRIALHGPYVAQVGRIIDGDTFEARLRIWFGQDLTVSVRLRNVDAPEMRGKCDSETRLAVEARDTLQEILQSGTVMLTDLSLDKYAGRVVASVSVAYPDTVEDVGALLLAGGYARTYGGGRRQGWCS